MIPWVVRQWRGLTLAHRMMGLGFKQAPEPCKHCARKPVLERGDEWLCCRCGCFALTEAARASLGWPVPS